jgi:hypothetical protein
MVVYTATGAARAAAGRVLAERQGAGPRDAVPSVFASYCIHLESAKELIR